ncbi:MAG: Dihydroorotate dehydrogenase (quinone) [Chroococcopsis gigantea SAG 12.99]|jgi:dihydroorotate dehydrogenase|nr:Dihydroorotate dehydrogenase (quinone) [Chroococcopsis gigantea SAG 12.99]
MSSLVDLTKPLYPIAFSAARHDLEGAHSQLMRGLYRLDRQRGGFWGQWLLNQLQDSFTVEDARLSQTLWGLHFPNPLGLAAGFDKEGFGAGVWSNFGFGFAEIGAVTLQGQPGNPKPRLFRLPEDKAALNRMGANNQGAEVIAERLREAWSRQSRTIPIGINLCKSKNTPLNEAHQDYLGSFILLRPQADYFVINVSSPNTPGLRSLQGGEELEVIFSTLQAENQGEKPLLVKISPDLDWQGIDTIIELVQTYKLSGIVATNTTTRRTGLKTQILTQTGKLLTQEAGGISGQPIREKSTEIIRYIYQKTSGTIPIVGIGGIFSPQDAWEKINAGASLLQVYTGWLYQGPWMIPHILQGLRQKLNLCGLTTIGDAKGTLD